MTTELTSIDIAGIMQAIPHRYPFLLIDKVIDVEKGVKAIGIKNVTMNENFFQGHFPAKPVMPGVLIVEAMAQTAGVIVVDSMGEEGQGKLVYFMSIESAKFRKPVGPGDVLQLRCVAIASRKNVWKFACEAFVENTKVAEATISAMIVL